MEMMGVEPMSKTIYIITLYAIRDRYSINPLYPPLHSFVYGERHSRIFYPKQLLLSSVVGG